MAFRRLPTRPPTDRKGHLRRFAIGQYSLHDGLEVPIRPSSGEELLAYEEGGDSVDAQVGRLLKISHDGLLVVPGLELVM